MCYERGSSRSYCLVSIRLMYSAIAGSVYISRKTTVYGVPQEARDTVEDTITHLPRPRLLLRIVDQLASEG
jgi:hypothetical protein